MGMTVPIDPRRDKGICSNCKCLSVQVTDTGQEDVHCARYIISDGQGPLIPIRKRIAACSDFDQTRNINYSSWDAWSINRTNEGVTISKNEVRFFGGRYQERSYKNGHYVWEDLPAPSSIDDSGLS